MRFSHDSDIEAFRGEVRAFIAAELAPVPCTPVGVPRFPSWDDEYAYVMGFQRKLAARGWFAMAWPKEYGGAGAAHMRQLVYNEEMSFAAAPHANMGIQWVGPSLMLYGSDAQKREYLPRIAGARHWWCTLYSEPGAGSDLAALQTRAVREGDDFVVNGQKIWTTGGHLADWGWLAARTDANAPKHKGISLFLVDMRSPGITVGPLPNMAGGLPGQHVFNEVFFENVRIPAAQLVGEVNRGWYLLTVALDFERSGISSFASSRRGVTQMAALARGNPGLAGRRPAMVAEIADRAIEVAVGTMLAYRVATMQSKGLVPNHEASMSRVFGSELGQRVARTGIRLLGLSGELIAGSTRLIVDAATPYLDSVSLTVAAGTSEVQRGIIATRGLGLPRE